LLGRPKYDTNREVGDFSISERDVLAFVQNIVEAALERRDANKNKKMVRE